MTFICPICTHIVDQYGDHIEGKVEAGMQTVVCVPCRLEAMRVKAKSVKSFPKLREGYVALPYRDD